MDRAPAPLDQAKVSATLAPTLGRSRTLPAEAYLSEEVFSWERRHLFEGSWVCVGRTEGLGDAGRAAGAIGVLGVERQRDADAGAECVRKLS